MGGQRGGTLLLEGGALGGRFPRNTAISPQKRAAGFGPLARPRLSPWKRRRGVRWERKLWLQPMRSRTALRMRCTAHRCMLGDGVPSQLVYKALPPPPSPYKPPMPPTHTHDPPSCLRTPLCPPQAPSGPPRDPPSALRTPSEPPQTPQNPPGAIRTPPHVPLRALRTPPDPPPRSTEEHGEVGAGEGGGGAQTLY